jgi:hypothetical protein
MRCVFFLQTSNLHSNKNKKHIKIKKIKKLKVSIKKLKPGDFTVAEGHGHPLV